LLLALSELNKMGARYCQSIINSNRTASLMTHFKAGFHPQYNTKYVVFRQGLRYTNFIQRTRLRIRLKRVYKKYILNLGRRIVLKNQMEGKSNQ